MANPAYGAFAFQKPVKGESYMKSKDRRADRVQAEQRVMRDAKKRDHGKCRWMNCTGKHRGLELPVDACHQTHRGMGGNSAGDRTTTATVISLCRKCHQKWDAGLIDVQPLSKDGFDGLVSFHEKHPETGVMEHVASESRHGVSVRRAKA